MNDDITHILVSHFLKNTVKFVKLVCEHELTMKAILRRQTLKNGSKLTIVKIQKNVPNSRQNSDTEYFICYCFIGGSSK